MNQHGLMRLFAAALLNQTPLPVANSDSQTATLLPPADDTLVKIGDGTTTWDIQVFGASSAAYMYWDASASQLQFTTADIKFTTAQDIIAPANTAAALEISDGTTKVMAVDSRNTIANVSNVTITGIAPTIASAAAAHINASLNIAAKTITYTGTTGTTSSLGAQLYVAAPTFTDASVMTLTTASSVHIVAVAAAGGSLTITNSRMISTSVSDAYLTNAGVWTDTACWGYGKTKISKAAVRARKAIKDVLAKIVPKTWKYRKNLNIDGIDGTKIRMKIDDRNRDRVGIVYDDLPDELRAPGEERGVSAGLLASFCLAAIKMLSEENEDLRGRIAALEAQ